MNTHQPTSHAGGLTLRRCSLALLLAAAAASACGSVDDVKTRHSEGTAGTAGTAGNGATAGSSSGGADAMPGTAGASAGADATAGAGLGGADSDGVCQPGQRGCDGDTPQVCMAGAWVAETPCDATIEACTGAGVCAAFRLTDAAIGAFGLRPAEPVPGAQLILKSQTLSAAPRTCNTQLCITGDLR